MATCSEHSCTCLLFHSPSILLFLVASPFPHSLMIRGLRLKATLVTQGFPADISHSPKRKSKESISPSFLKEGSSWQRREKALKLRGMSLRQRGRHTNRVTGVLPLKCCSSSVSVWLPCSKYNKMQKYPTVLILLSKCSLSFSSLSLWVCRNCWVTPEGRSWPINQRSRRFPSRGGDRV